MPSGEYAQKVGELVSVRFRHEPVDPDVTLIHVERREVSHTHGHGALTYVASDPKIELTVPKSNPSRSD